MQLTLKHTAGNFVIQAISLLSVFANQVLIMQNLTSWTVALVTSVAKKDPFWKKKKALHTDSSSTKGMFVQG